VILRPVVAWIGGDPEAGARLGVARELQGADVVHVFGPREGLGRSAWDATIAGARAVVLSPQDGPWPLPWWHRRFARFLFRTQEEAKRWMAAGLPLGRTVVVEDLADLWPVYVEVAEMGRSARR
jgi:hypothetical protein